jgi:hypothetical protein
MYVSTKVLIMLKGLNQKTITIYLTKLYSTMTKLLLKLSGVAFILTLLLWTGCTEDDTTTDPLGPTISLASGAGLVDIDTTFQSATEVTFNVQVTATVGDNNLRTLTFLVDGVAPGAADIGNYIKSITANGTPITPNNPLLITTNATGGFWDVEIVTFGQVLDVPVEYGFEVEDEVGEIAFTSVIVTLTDPGTPLDNTIPGVLLNQAGPAGTGGVNLETGMSTGSTVAESDLRDLGIDCDIDPGTAENWVQKIGSVNGTNLVSVDPTALGEDFTFDKVETKEAIVAAYDAGAALADGMEVDCNPVAVTDVSDVVSVGDIFAALTSEGVYYLIQIDAVTPSFGDNNDQYEMTIKF